VRSAVEELDRVANLCAQLDLAVSERDWVGRVLEPIAELVDAETASLRRFGLANGAPAPLAIVSAGIPGSVRDAYLDRYFALDPVRRLLARHLDTPLFDDPARRGEWSTEDAAPASRAAYREEFRRYRQEFLLPNHFYHHVGFCVQDSAGGMLVLDFHRPAGAAQFSALERARARVAAGYLHAQAGQKRAGASKSGGPSDLELTTREIQVAKAVATGLSNKQVAESLGISVRTVENHLRSIFAKCNVATRTRLAAKLRESNGDPRV
jgi:DNA-binding CsgD family transcriptional regulator